MNPALPHRSSPARSSWYREKAPLLRRVLTGCPKCCDVLGNAMQGRRFHAALSTPLNHMFLGKPQSGRWTVPLLTPVSMVISHQECPLARGAAILAASTTTRGLPRRLLYCPRT
jgi:hypothetical protein